jgi:hypothetical protein
VKSVSTLPDAPRREANETTLLRAIPRDARGCVDGPRGGSFTAKCVRGVVGSCERLLVGVLGTTFPELACPAVTLPTMRVLMTRAFDGSHAIVFRVARAMRLFTRGALAMFRGRPATNEAAPALRLLRERPSIAGARRDAA